MSAVESAESLLVTAAGYEQLCAELEILRSEGRRAANERVREAREDGDLDSNPALYDAAKEQTRIEQRIAILETQLADARVAAPVADGTAGIGSFVRVRDLESGDVTEYELVGAIEPDVGNGRVSVGAPVGRALLAHRAGAIVEVETPRATLELEVLGVRPGIPTRAGRKAA